MANVYKSNDVLIVDDDKEICNVIEMYLENMGCFRNIIKAHDGSIAASKLTNQRFGLVLLDLNLPKRSGIDVLKLFDKSALNAVESVVIVSGEMGKEVMTTALRQGVRFFLIKPFDETSFQQKVIESLKETRKKAAEKAPKRR
jgi:two-component system, chemotaxis family, chemotaxis protein CheY